MVQLLDQLLQFGDVLCAQLATFAEVRDQRRHAPLEDTPDEVLALRLHPSLALQQRPIQVTPSIALGGNRAPLVSRRLSRVLMVGSAQSRWASAATTSSALRGACCHSTSITTASASLIGVMVYIRNRHLDYARNRIICQALDSGSSRLRQHRFLPPQAPDESAAQEGFPGRAGAPLLEPGPIVLVSTAWQGQRNLMTMGWHMVMGFSPSLVATYLWNENHSHALAVGSGECVINVPGVELLDTVVDIGNCSGREVDGLDALPASEVGAPLVGQCHSCFECRLYDDSQVASSNLFVGKCARPCCAPAETAAHGALPRRRAVHGGRHRSVASTAVQARHAVMPALPTRRTAPHDRTPHRPGRRCRLVVCAWTAAGSGHFWQATPAAHALYARVEHDPSRPLQLYTALSLNPPKARGNGLEARFRRRSRAISATISRDWPMPMRSRATRCRHMCRWKSSTCSPAPCSGRQAQSSYTSLNYPCRRRGGAARTAGDRAEGGDARTTAGFLSCNNDITQDTLDAMIGRGLPRPPPIAEIDPQLPYMGGSATVDVSFFDLVITPPPPYLRVPRCRSRSAMPTTPLPVRQHAGARRRHPQIGIGTLADALSHALVLRHTDNARYRRVLHALDPQLASHPLVQEIGGLDPFEVGLYGCSEMLNEGFRRLVQTGDRARCTTTWR